MTKNKNAKNTNTTNGRNAYNSTTTNGKNSTNNSAGEKNGMDSKNSTKNCDY